jgi:multidrug efflux pump subunit AcrB
VELPPSELTADFLDRTLIRTAAGDYVSLADIVTVDRRGGFSTVRRENGLRLVSVTGDISEDDPARAAEITEALRADILPALEEQFGVTTRLSGLAEQENEFLTDAALGFGLCLLGIYLCLSWIFSSWTRPAVVMAIIPFGLVGTIYGHHLWDVPLSMFTVVGLIGMTGIIINDSIVLVTTVDEYATERGLIPAIIDGTADRLRPVFLTTATTVLGLAPLLYESSAQAQFLKPTVITLVYGLGFGFVLVLLVVPALLAVQQDMTKQFAALRRAFNFRKGTRGVALGLMAVTLTMVAWFALTLGSVIATGGYAAPLAGLIPGAATPGLALAVFLAGAAVVAVVAYVLGGLVYALGRMRAA